MYSTHVTIAKPPSRQSSGGSAVSSIAEEGESPPSITYTPPRRQSSRGSVEPPQEMDDRDDTHSMLSHASTTRTLVSPYQPRTSKEYTGYGFTSLKDRPTYLSESVHKSLPMLPRAFSTDEEEIPSSGGRVAHTRYDLSIALGEDNLQHTTEIDTIPCAGIRISNGNLKGLIAWRLVVKIGGKDGLFPKHEVSPHTPSKEHFKHKSHSPGKPSFSSSFSAESEEDEKYYPGQRQSLHVPTYSKSPMSPAFFMPPAEGYNAVTANFIMDTSQYTSSIPRETLFALGFKPHNVYPGKAVLLRVQGVDTRFCVGRDGEAGRLGIQFLEDANTSLVIDKEIGPVLYGEISQLKDVPRTVKFSLQQRVRSLLGMNKLS
ncbi:hypothetical protein BDQ17DRAFT_963193 [Cyathus striatus]|nr:hypothetical protein BDQ17DRAFT_963193 [Cyathus striatus]